MGHIKMCRSLYPLDFGVRPYLVGDRIFTEVIEFKSEVTGVCLYVTDVLMKRENLDTKTETHRENKTEIHRENAM